MIVKYNTKQYILKSMHNAYTYKKRMIYIIMLLFNYQKNDTLKYLYFQKQFSKTY